MDSTWLLAILAALTLPKIGDSASNKQVIKRANWLARQGRGYQGLNLLENRMCVRSKPTTGNDYFLQALKSTVVFLLLQYNCIHFYMD